MAEAVVSVVVEQLADLLLKQAKDEIDLLTGVEKRVLSLSTTLKRIQAVLADAERKKISEETVKAWLQDLEDVSYEIDDVLDEWNYIILRQKIEGTNRGNASPSIGKQRVCSFIPSSGSCFKQAFVNRDIAVKIKELSGRLDLIEKQKYQFSFITSSGVASNSQERKRAQSSSLVDVSEVFGRLFDKKNLVSQLLSESHEEEKNAPQVLSVIGTGGIGKTALVQLAYNDNQVMGHFDKRGWVCVSDPFDQIKVANAILESLELSPPNLKQLDPLLQRVRDSTFGKRFLLVLDDVWTEDPMELEPFKISLKHGAPGSTILLTTRSERVARAADSTCMIHLDVLSDSESWSFFHRVAFPDQTNRTERERERLENIGREIVKKCKGLPLAIKTMGGLLRFKNSVAEWEKVMDSNMWELDVAKVELFPHLYLSYNDLPSPIRRCFSYCAVFPKDKLIEVDDLIRIWMAQGYLNSSGSEDEMQVIGREYFEHLASRSFFQDFIKYDTNERIITCKMHDIVHDFAKYLKRRECLVIEGKRKEIFCENARHVTWLGSEEATDTLPNCDMGQPRSFSAKYLNLGTPTARLLNSLKLVRVLKLDHCGVTELPKEIGNLVHLRYLGLIHNKELRELPKSVYDLYNLQTLILEGCPELKELTPGIEKLTKLRHLILSLRIMKYPKGIGELTCLQTLSYFSVGRGYNELGYLKNLNQLHGSLEVWIMDNLDDVTDVKNAHLKSKKHIKELTFEFHTSIRVKEDVMKAFEPPPNLEKLNVHYFGGTQLPKWITSLDNLRELVLDQFFELTALPFLAIFPSLEKLMIKQFAQLKFVGLTLCVIRESLRSPAIVFPNLKEFIFDECGEWEEWEDISPDEEDDDTIPLIMPRLRMLRIYDCPKLKALPHRLLRKASSLECITLDGKEYNPSTILSTALTLPEIKARLDHRKPQLESLPNLIADVWSNSSNLLLEATIQFRKFVSIDDSRVKEEIIQSGVVPRFVEFLTREDFPQLQFEAAWALSNIASGTSENTQAVIDHGAVPTFVKLLGSPSHDVRQQAVWALGNISGDSPVCRDLVLGHGALMPLLIHLNEHAKLSMLKIATWTLANFCKGRPQPEFEQVKQALPVLQRLIYSNYKEVVSEACWALSYLSDGSNDKIQAVIEAGVCHRLVELLLHPSPSVLIPALRTVENIVAGDDAQTQCIIDHGALPALLSLLTHKHKNSIKSRACRTVCNITAGNRDQIQAVIEAGLIPPLINLLQTAGFDIKELAAKAILNATSRGTHDQIKFLVRQGCIKPLCDLLVCPHPRIATFCLNGLENILKIGKVQKNWGSTRGFDYFAQLIEEAENLEKIENLQS